MLWLAIFVPAKCSYFFFIHKQTPLIRPPHQQPHSEIPISVILYNYTLLIQPHKQVTYVHVFIVNILWTDWSCFFLNLHFEGLLKNGCLEVQEKSICDVCQDSLSAGSLCWLHRQRHPQTKWEVKTFVPGHSLALFLRLISCDFGHRFCSCCNAWEPAHQLLSRWHSK